MNNPIRILLQTTIPASDDDWSIERFSLLRDYLNGLKNETGNPLFAVTARNLEVDDKGSDPVLRTLDRSLFDELWLFAVDTGDGIGTDECTGITAFRKRGGGVLTTRDHMDLGSSLCNIGGIGAAHFFHSKQTEPEESRHRIDDPYTTDISWPNYHSGSNGDYQYVTIVEPPHELLQNSVAPKGIIEFLPSHPHEGAVGAPSGDPTARVIATGRSKITDTPFNLVVAFERAADDEGNMVGRGIADSSFHHFVDYNWDPRRGAPSFVSEPPGDGLGREPRAVEDTMAYVRNLATWLAPSNSESSL